MVQSFVGRADFDFFVRFENSELYKCSTTCWLEPTLSACLRCRALVGAYLLCCLCGVTAMCCAVLCCVVLVEQRK